MSLKGNITLTNINTSGYGFVFNKDKVTYRVVEENGFKQVALNPPILSIQPINTEGAATLSKDSYELRIYSLSLVTGKSGEEYQDFGDYFLTTSPLAEDQYITEGADAVTNFLSYDELTESWLLNLENLANRRSSLPVENDTDSFFLTQYQQVLEYLMTNICSNEALLAIELLINKVPVARYYIPITLIPSFSTARLDLNADGIVAAIGQSKLDFSDKGLTIYNNGIQIINDGEESFYVRQNADGKHILTLHGTIYAEDGVFGGELKAAKGTFSGDLAAAGGTFSGELRAAKGTFSGELAAATGTFAGDLFVGDLNKEYIAISNDSDNPGIYHYNRKNNLSNFKINTNGQVIAKDIQLERGNIGRINFNNSEIYTDSWSITPETATFNNIVASGKISSAIFEQGKLQTCGGTFIFKDASNISSLTEIEQYNYQIEGIEEGFLRENHLYLVTNSSRSYSFFAEYQNDVLVAQKAPPADIGLFDLILDLGEVNSTGLPEDWLIGINSTVNKLGAAGLSENSITFSAVERDNNNQYVLSPKIILGRIPRGILEKDSAQTYGLYAESVYLTGTLTTKYSVETDDSEKVTHYAGINTISGAPFNDAITNNQIDDKTNIIFWAGARGTSEVDIQQSNFQVTDQGTLYAKDAYFTNSLLANAQIESSVLVASEIIGRPDKAALKISDSDVGIEFHGPDAIRDQSTGEIISPPKLLVDSNKMELRVPLIFNTNRNFDIEQISVLAKKLFIANENSNSGLLVTPQGFGLFKNANDYLKKVNLDDNVIEDFSIIYKNNDLILATRLKTEKIPKVKINEANTVIMNELDIQNNYTLTGVGRRAEYRIIEENNTYGFDLYVY